MFLANPAFRKFVSGIEEVNKYDYKKAIDTVNIYAEVDNLHQVFLNEISNQITLLSKSQQLNVLEQLLYDLSDFKEFYYFEKSWPDSKIDQYYPYSKYCSIENRYRYDYNIIDQIQSELNLWKGVYSIVSLYNQGKIILNDKINDSDIIRMKQLVISTYYHYAQELIRIRYARMVGREKALVWIFDLYDKARESMLIEDIKVREEGATVDMRPWQKIVEFHRSYVSSIGRKDIDALVGLKGEGDSLQINNPPLKWQGKLNHLLELFVELHRKGFIDLHNCSYIALSKAICSLFKTSEYGIDSSWQTIQTYLSTKNKYSEPYSGRNNEFENLSKLPALRNRKFGGIKPL